MSYIEKAPLAKDSWFKVGGEADILFIPPSIESLSNFLINKPKDVELNIIGLCSNIIIRDKGISGFVIKLGKAFTDVAVDGCLVKVGCGLPNNQFVSQLLKAGLTGLEFLSGIPGSIGGAIAMNAGCYGHEVKDFLIGITAVSKVTGKICQLAAKELCLEYRHNPFTDEFIFTDATFLLKSEPDRNKMKKAIIEISQMKLATQPGSMKTGGSTFKNPNGHKAWELIDNAGLRGFAIGGARVSPMHTNFLINEGKATSQDLESLGELIIEKVREKFNITLEWEIKRIGKQ